MRRLLAGMGMLVCGSVGAASLSAMLETKLQVDNRFNITPRVLGEVWGDAELLESGRWRAHASWAGRLSSLSDDSGGRLYQAFWEGLLPRFQGTLRLGRFQRADLAGFYLLDGGQLDYRLKDWRVQWYGGRPLRLDHVRGIEGDSVFGVTLERDKAENRCWHGFCWQGYRTVFSYQEFRNHRLSRRLQGNASVRGMWGDRRAWEMALSATYRFDRRHFEDVWFNGFIDLTPVLRFRANYEYYRPRSPFPTFRERFVSAYALGEQSLFRAELHHRPRPSLHYYLGGQRATKADGFDGYGLIGGGDYRWRDTVFALRYDFLEIGYDRAHSGYGQIRHALNSRLEAWINGAVRREEKLLYGVNWVRGGEAGFRYHIGSGWTVQTSLSYIANSRRRDDYVGTVRVIYYLDRFQPKGKTCVWSC